MANIKSFPNNQDVFIGAEDVMKWLHGRTSGVFAAENNACVSIVQNAMAVNVSDGLGWMANAGKDGIVWWNDHEAVNGTKLKLFFDAADSALNRIDRIIVEWKTTNYVDLPEVKVLKGTVASNAVAPALTNNSTVRQISLARIYVAAGTTAITADMITDERLDPSVCGLVTESVKIDTSTMQNQFEALLKTIQNELMELNAGTAALLKTGDTMQGTLDMDGNKIKNVATPENEGDAVNKKFVDDAFANFEYGISMELLWENASPTSSFATQTISMDYSNHDKLLVIFRRSKNLAYTLPVILVDAKVGACANIFHSSYDSAVYTFNRNFTLVDGGINFAGATKQARTTTDYLIPTSIYGVKGVS